MKKTIIFTMLMVIPVLTRSEFFIDVYGGSANTYGGSYDATQTRYIGEASEVRRTFAGDFDGSQSAMAGVRGGYWLKNLKWLGGALDLNVFEVESQNSDVEVLFVTFSPALMLRYPFQIDENFPNGRYYPYAGMGASLVLTDIHDGGQGGSNEDYDADNYGWFFCAGATWMIHRNVGLFIEYRHVSISFDESGEWHNTTLFGHRSYHSYDAEGDAKAHQFLGGVTVHF